MKLITFSLVILTVIMPLMVPVVVPAIVTAIEATAHGADDEHRACHYALERAGRELHAGPSSRTLARSWHVMHAPRKSARPCCCAGW